jgi:hypothetical protein
MTTQSLLTMKPMPGGLTDQIQVDGWSWVNGGAVCGLCLGIISPIIGSILTAIAWFTGPEWHGLHLHRTGTLLFVLTIPLLAFGAHCLDLSERQDKPGVERSGTPG